MHTAHSIHHLRYSQMDDEARQGKRLFRRQFVLFSHEFHHFRGARKVKKQKLLEFNGGCRMSGQFAKVGLNGTYHDVTSRR